MSLPTKDRCSRKGKVGGMGCAALVWDRNLRLQLIELKEVAEILRDDDGPSVMSGTWSAVETVLSGATMNARWFLPLDL